MYQSKAIFPKKSMAQEVMEELLSAGRRGKIQATWGGFVILLSDDTYLQPTDPILN